MIDYRFATPIMLIGTEAHTLKEAARVLRRHSLEADSYRSWELMRTLRDIETSCQAEKAERHLRQWAIHHEG